MKKHLFKKTAVGIFVIFLSLTAGSAVKVSFGKGEMILTLDQAIREAINNNYLIKEAIEKERAAVKEERSSMADFFPKLSASYSYTRLRHAPFAIFHGPGAPTASPKVAIGRRDNFSWDVTINQPLFTGFALITKSKIAQLGVDMREIEKEQAILDIIKQVKVTYFRILLAKRYIGVSHEEVKQLQSHVRDAKQYYAQGIIPYNDLLKSQVALAQAKQNLVLAKSNLKVTIASLNILLRRHITEETEVQDIPGFKARKYELAQLFKKALEKRPELKDLRLALKQADLHTKLARSNYYPRIYLTGQYEQKGDDVRATNNDFGNSHNASIGLQAQWTFFEWGKTRAEVEKSLHQKLALEEKTRGIEDSIKLEVNDAFHKLIDAQQNVHTAEEALKQARENFRITNLQYQQQVTTSTEVLDARTFLTQAEVNYYGSLYGYMTARAELERAIGER